MSSSFVLLWLMIDMALRPTTAIPTTSPNIIIFFIDDILFTESWQEFAPKGKDLEGKTVRYSDYPTPNIAAFINEAVVFPKSYCAAPKCAPSRFALLTGRQTVRSKFAIEQTLATSSGEFGTNITLPTSKLLYDDSFDNIPYVLKNDINTPYYTGMVGKWHIMSLIDNGYRYGCIGLDSTPNAELYANCTQIVKEQGFDFVDAFYYANIPQNPQYFSHNPEWMVSQSQKFINEAINVENKPFFLYFASTLTHTPSIITALSDFSSSDSPKGTLTGNDRPDDTSMSTRNSILVQAISEGGTNVFRQELYASYTWIDDTFGALINYLKTNNLYDNTFIVLMNDHGMSAKGLLYEQGTRIINFVRYPPLFGDNGPYIMSDDFVVSNVDLGAVIFELTNITPPDGYKLDGKSWISDVQNEINNPNTAQQTCCKYRYIDVYNSHSIVSEQYQYIYRANPNLVEIDHNIDTLYPNTYDQEQIYDLISDPNQKINQIGNASLSTTIAIFQTLIRDYIQDICPIDTPCKMPDFLFTLSPTIDSNTTPSPINNPTPSPTNNPTPSPTNNPTPSPTADPTPSPTANPTPSPTEQPSNQPTLTPTAPTDSPSKPPTATGETWSPSKSPTKTPSYQPSTSPSNQPSMSPTDNTSFPSKLPTKNPTVFGETYSPTHSPSNNPTEIPTLETKEASLAPTLLPTAYKIPSATKDEAGESWTDISQFGTTQIIVYAVVALLICLCCIGLIILIKKCKDKKNENYVKSKAAEAATLTITTSGGFGNNNKGNKHMIVPSGSNVIQMGDRKGKHVIVPSTSNVWSYDYDDNNGTDRLTSTAEHHLVLPSIGDVTTALTEPKTMSEAYHE